jgi:hypothetical protein
VNLIAEAATQYNEIRELHSCMDAKTRGLFRRLHHLFNGNNIIITLKTKFLSTLWRGGREKGGVECDEYVE